MTNVLKRNEAEGLDRWWRAANYLSACQLYLLDNPLLTEPLTREQVKRKIVGHWGTVPGQNFIYTHLNRLIRKYDLDMIYLSGPGHGGNAMVAQDWLDGSYSEVYPNISQDKEGMRKLFKQFSFPGGVSSHVAPETPGSIHEGGELGYSLAHAFGAVMDNPELIAACVVGDGESETGPLATAWQSNKFLNPVRDGVVLPILHLNGYKIANPTVLARTSDEDLEKFFSGMGWQPYFVEGSDPMPMHEAMAEALEACYGDIRTIRKSAREGKPSGKKWPMIVLRTPKGWTGPKEVDGKPLDGSGFTSISAFGAYAVVASGADSEVRLTSFTVTPTKTGMVSSLRLPTDFEISEVTIDGAPQLLKSANTVDFTQEGSYVVSYRCVPADTSFGLKLVIDHTPPEVTFEGVVDGEARGPVKVVGLAKSDTLDLTRDGKSVKLKLDNTLRSPGDYVAVITDDAGNSVTEKFTIGMYLNYQGLLFGLLAIAVIAAAAIYMYMARKRLKVR